ncbi:hypothetical protein GCM10010306_005630 [Streptomyces umbrinus]|nr:hypothetical protein GCM10010306_005630 [Streptomyces umbrinus]
MTDGGKGRFALRSWTLRLGGLALVSGALLWALAAGDGSLELSERTDLIAMATAVLGAIATGAALWRRPGEGHSEQAAVMAQLARTVRVVGERQWARALGGDLEAIDVTFAFRPYATARAATLPAGSTGRLARVVEDFREICPRRLVITGEPGAGKTVLARKLAMGLIAVRSDDDPVPVLLPLADWDWEERFTDWVVRHLEHDFGLRAETARILMEAHKILPVLDGLDEMDDAGLPLERSRARKALMALDLYQHGTDPAPLVLTCRTRQYDALEADGSHMVDAARIEIASLTAGQILAFLGRRGAARRPALWQGVLDQIERCPAGVLARSLSTPWRLTLAAAVYERTGEPDELLVPETEEEMADLLLGRFIGAAVSSTTKAPGRHREEDVHRWLSALASCMVSTSASPVVPSSTEPSPVGSSPGAAETEVVIRWLRGPLGVERAKRVLRVLYLLCGCAGVAVFVREGVSVLSGVAGACWFTVLTVEGVRRTLRTGPWRSSLNWRMPALGSALWRVAAILAFRDKWGWFPAALIVLMVSTPVAASFPALHGTLGSLPQVLPLLPFLGFLLADMVAGCLDAAVIGPSGWSRAGGYAVATGVLLLLALAVGGQSRGILGALTVVVLVGLFLLHEWAEHACSVLLHRPRLPFRLVRFLEWCVSAGLMRTSGLAYQFRHREFQEWLVRHPEPVSPEPSVS